MMKSFLNWLLDKVPVSNWVIIVLMFGFAVISAITLRMLLRKASEK